MIDNGSNHQTSAEVVSTDPQLPPALSHEELLERADIAGRARILKVVRSNKVGSYVATLRFEAFTKGGPRTDIPWLTWLPSLSTFTVKMRRAQRGSNGKPLPGEWFDGYRAGDTVMTHLVWDEKIGFYVTLWWNAVWQVPTSGRKAKWRLRK